MMPPPKVTGCAGQTVSLKGPKKRLADERVVLASRSMMARWKRITTTRSRQRKTRLIWVKRPSPNCVAARYRLTKRQMTRRGEQERSKEKSVAVEVTPHQDTELRAATAAGFPCCSKARIHTV